MTDGLVGSDRQPPVPALETEMVISFLALGPQGARVSCLLQKSRWKTFRNMGSCSQLCLQAALPPEQLKICSLNGHYHVTALYWALWSLKTSNLGFPTENPLHGSIAV